MPRYGLLHDPRRGSLLGRILGGHPELVDEMTDDSRTQTTVGLVFGPATA